MLSLDTELRTKLWRQVIESIESYTNEVREMDVVPEFHARRLAGYPQAFRLRAVRSKSGIAAFGPRIDQKHL
jgi:hypothetical protein